MNRQTVRSLNRLARNASLRQHIADLEASGAVMEHVTLESSWDGTAFDVADGVYLPCHVFTGWEGQS